MNFSHRNQLINVNGEEIEIFKVNNDVNGNPRYVVHFLHLGVKMDDYRKIKGLTRYRAKWFGGGYVFTSHNPKDYLKHMLEVVEDYYSKQ